MTCFFFIILGEAHAYTHTYAHMWVHDELSDYRDLFIAGEVGSCFFFRLRKHILEGCAGNLKYVID